MSQEPFPDIPTYEELEEKKPSPEEMFESGFEQTTDEDSWYNQAPYVAARIIIEVARQSDDFREEIIENEQLGVAHKMSEYDEESHEKLNTMGLSSFQGGIAERIARDYLSE